MKPGRGRGNKRGSCSSQTLTVNLPLDLGPEGVSFVHNLYIYIYIYMPMQMCIYTYMQMYVHLYIFALSHWRWSGRCACSQVSPHRPLLPAWHRGGDSTRRRIRRRSTPALKASELTECCLVAPRLPPSNQKAVPRETIISVI